MGSLPPDQTAVMYLPGEQSQVADFLSRHKPLPGEWQLHPEVVHGISSPRRCRHTAPSENTSPLSQDALAHMWPGGLLYAFPSFPLILPTLLRVLRQGHRLHLVAPQDVVFSAADSAVGHSGASPAGRTSCPSREVGWHPDPCHLQLWPLEVPTNC